MDKINHTHIEPSSVASLEVSTAAEDHDTSTISPAFLLGTLWREFSIQDTSEDKDNSLLSSPDNHVPLQVVDCKCRDSLSPNAYCVDCKEYLCLECVSAHLRVTLTKDHSLIQISSFNPISEDMMTSSQSLVEPQSRNWCNQAKCPCKDQYCDLDVFCHSCNQHLCMKSALDSHVNHEWKYLKNANEQNKVKLDLLLKGARNKLNSLKQCKNSVNATLCTLDLKEKKIIAEIENITNATINWARKHEQQLISETRHIHRMKTKTLRQQVDNVQFWERLIENTVAEIEQWRALRGRFLLLQAPARLNSILVSTGVADAVNAPHEDDVISFVHRSMSVVGEKLGDVISSVCAENCKLERQGSDGNIGICGTSAHFIIHVRDHLSNRQCKIRDEFTVYVTPPDGATFPCSVMTSHIDDSVLKFQFKLMREGQHRVDAKCRSLRLPGCPLIINAKQQTDYATRALQNATACVFGVQGSQQGELSRPWGICSDSMGHLIVADRSNHRIQVFKSTGAFCHTFGSHGAAAGQFFRPAGVAVNQQHEIIVADKDNHRIQVFSFEGRFIRKFGERGSKTGQFNYPWDVAVDKVSRIAVSDTRNNRVQLFDNKGNFISKYGYEGDMRRFFELPRGVAFLPNGRIVVTDFNNHRLVIIGWDMLTAHFVGRQGDEMIQFQRPQGVAVDDYGNIVVADSKNQRIQVISENGEIKAVFNRVSGPHPSTMDRPSGITVQPSGHIAVVDFGNNRIVVF